MNVKTQAFFLISIIFHLSLLLYFYKMKKIEILNSVMSIPAYTISSSERILPEKQLLSKNALTKTQPEKNAITMHKKSANIAYEKNDKSTVHRMLLKILHDKIAEKQVYPESASQLNQHGTVTVHFMLDSNGFIHQIVLAKSSGFGMLDSAAIDAVQAISPLENMNQRLKNTEEFSVDILYQ